MVLKRKKKETSHANVELGGEEKEGKTREQPGAEHDCHSKRERGLDTQQSRIVVLQFAKKTCV